MQSLYIQLSLSVSLVFICCCSVTSQFTSDNLFQQSEKQIFVPVGYILKPINVKKYIAGRTFRKHILSAGRNAASDRYLSVKNTRVNPKLLSTVYHHFKSSPLMMESLEKYLILQNKRRRNVDISLKDGPVNKYTRSKKSGDDRGIDVMKKPEYYETIKSFYWGRPGGR